MTLLVNKDICILAELTVNLGVHFGILHSFLAQFNSNHFLYFLQNQGEKICLWYVNVNVTIMHISN